MRVSRTGLSVQWWEVGVSAVGALLGLAYLLSNTWVVGVGLLCAASIWLVTRVRVEGDPVKPGHVARLRGWLGIVKTLLILGVYAAVAVASWLLHRDHASRTRVGVIATFAIAGLAFLLFRELQEAGDDALKWLIGGRAEQRVGRQLDQLRERGWLVLHGVAKDRGGDIDHIVCGPNGAFAIETKSYRLSRSDYRQALGNAVWLKETLGISWATGVLCVNEDREPRKSDHIWTVGQDQLLPWLDVQHGSSIDIEAARNALTSDGDSE